MDLKIVEIDPGDCNIILGQSHFIKTVEDLHETLAETIPNAKFGIGFCESSGDCLVRKSGNDEKLIKKASQKAKEIGDGHSLIVYIKDAYPVAVLNKIKNVSEVCRIFCTTANNTQVILAETKQGRGILGVIDGYSPKGIETEEKIKERKELLRKIGYKL